MIEEYSKKKNESEEKQNDNESKKSDKEFKYEINNSHPGKDQHDKDKETDILELESLINKYEYNKVMLNINYSVTEKAYNSYLLFLESLKRSRKNKVNYNTGNCTISILLYLTVSLIGIFIGSYLNKFNY